MSNKTIDTLVDDIYNLFENGYDITEEEANEFGQRMAGLITSRLKEAGKKREPRLRLSGIAKADYKLWYEMKGYEPDTPMLPHTYIKFLFGDIIEELVLSLAKWAGHTVEEEQAEVELNGVKGHKDARIDGITVDVKSASSFSFKKFQQGTMLDNPQGFDQQYLGQIAAYIQADKESGLHPDDTMGAFVVMDKQHGRLTVLKVDAFMMPNMSERIDYIRNELLPMEEPPAPDYEPEPMGTSGNMVLPNTAGYCDHKFKIYPNLRVFRYSNGLKFFTHVEKEPNVPEITHLFTNKEAVDAEQEE